MTPKKAKKKEVHEKKKVKKEKSKEKRAKQLEIYKRKALGLIIGLVGIFLLLFIIFYTISRVFRPMDFAMMLPRDSTIGLVQININNRNEQVQRFYQALSKYDVYYPDKITAIISEKLDADFKNEINPWLNRQTGLAFIEKEETQGEMDILFFAETRDKGEAMNFLQSRGLETQEDYILHEDYRGVPIYRYALSQTFNFIFLNNYLIIGNNENVLKKAIDSHRDANAKLANNAKYQKIAQNLPNNNLIFAYIDVEKGINFLKGNEGFMSEKGRELLAFEPFLRLYRAFGYTAIMENSNIAIQTFISLNEEYLSGRDFINFDTKFRANLLSQMPQDVLMYAGGFNLKKQLHRYSELFSAGGDVSYLIFEGTLRAQKNKYFGEEVNLEEDIYPLLEGEYAFALTGSSDETAVAILLELQDPLRDKDKIETITDSFIRKSAILAPKVIEVELEDGTISEEIQTIPEEIIRSTEDHHGYEINVLSIGSQSWGIFYLIVDDTLLISTKKEHIKNLLDLVDDSQGSFKNTFLYRDSIAPVLRTSDEVIFGNVEHIKSHINEIIPEWLSPYIEPYKYISAGRNYFKDGISTIHYIKIE